MVELLQRDGASGRRVHHAIVAAHHAIVAAHHALVATHHRSCILHASGYGNFVANVCREFLRIAGDFIALLVSTECSQVIV